MTLPAKLRVLHVLPRGRSPSGMVFARRQIRALEAAGVEGRTLELSGSALPWRVRGERRRLREEIEAFRPDLVHAHYGTMIGWQCARATELPVVVTFRGSDLNPAPNKGWLRSAAGRFLSHRAARRARRIVCVSAALLERLRWGRERAEVIPSGVDTSLFRPLPRDEARRTLGWPGDERVVLFSRGGAPPNKRFDLAQAVVAAARKLAEPFRFEVLDGSVPPDRIPFHLNAADCLLFTSAFEGSPNIVKEAVACGLPVVSVDVGDVRERLSGVEPSAVVADDPDVLAKALADQLARGGRSNGPERARAFSLEETTARWMAVYRSALATGSPAPPP